MTDFDWRKRPRSLRCDAQPMPADFPDVAPTLGRKALQRRYKAGWQTIDRWLNQAGVSTAPRPQQDVRPLPADFADLAPTMSHRALKRHYGARDSIVDRWLGEAGVSYYRPEPKPKPVKKPAFFAGPRPWAPHNVPLPSGREQEAAQHLRRLTFVFRCHEGGTAAPRGRFWRYGNIVLTGEQLIERAIRHGYDPDAWRRVAA